MGIRATFGAVSSDLISLVLRQAARLAVLGLVLGSTLFFLFSGVIKSQLYGVGVMNMLPFAVGALTLLSVAIVASVVPALRVARFDPNEVLRGE
jgi:ABC-type antimicrobial peptide transport system permease subunit